MSIFSKSLLTNSSVVLVAMLIATRRVGTLQLSVVPSGGAGNNGNTRNFVTEYIASMGLHHSIEVIGNPLVTRQSMFQTIEVHDSPHYGRILVLDGVVQVTERDGCAYNEMMAHIPMFQHKKPERVLIIGGGDGYVLSEVLKHSDTLHVDHVDLDGEVISVCKDFFPWGSAWNDDRVHLHLEDGAKFVENAPDAYYDVIIQDSSDPSVTDELGNEVDLPSAVLYTKSHLMNLHRILKEDGILNLQAECMQIPEDMLGVKEWRELALRTGFESVRYGSISISSYPTGQIGFLLCEKQEMAKGPSDQIFVRYQEMIKENQRTNYYHPRLQTSSFDLPLWAEEAIYESPTSYLRSD